MLSGDRAALYDRKSTSGIAVAPEILKEFSVFKDAPSESNSWILAGYDPSVKDSIVKRAEGKGGYEAMKAELKEDEVLFGVCAFYVGGTRKFFFLTSVGSAVGGMKKARVSMHKSGVYNAFDGIVADVMITDAEEASPDAVLAKLRKDTGGSDVRFSL